MRVTDDRPPLSVKRAVFLVSLSTGVGAVAGLLIGWMMGKFAPGYYDSTFEVVTDPEQLGIGLGLTQGLGAGLVVGILLVLVALFGKR